MKVCVFGLWHLGSVTAACLAQAGHQVTGLDPDDATVNDLSQGTPPVYEPGLADLVADGLNTRKLRFTSDAPSAVQEAAVVWVTFDTPVDDDDRADVDYVTDHIEGIFPYLQDGAVVLLSSQLPVGTAAALRSEYVDHGGTARVSFATSPENLRLGQAIDVFTNPDRVVVGVDDDHAREVITELLAPLTDQIEWMRTASAEMTKHALNAFLAASVTFANEIAALCEQVGADAKEVERGLKTERRIGPGAYLGPGGAFAGGTLARDVAFLGALAAHHDLTLPLIAAIPHSNDTHKLWAVRRLRDLFGNLHGQHIAILGLTYKPQTNTLRRSLSVEIARELVADGAMVHAHDPAIDTLPDALNEFIRLHSTIPGALNSAAAVIIATPWDAYRNLPAGTFGGKTVLDASGFLRRSLANAPDVTYYAVGVS